MYKPNNNNIYVRPIDEDEPRWTKNELGLITKTKGSIIKHGEIIAVSDTLKEKYRYLKKGSIILYNKNEVFNTLADNTFFMNAKNVIAIVVAEEK